ncbi:MAG: hypothetical protein KF805_00790 [Phycisphaeraceae bacterium]|nr:hypothetical protein [Phycisphaeraceae bacterium]
MLSALRCVHPLAILTTLALVAPFGLGAPRASAAVSVYGVAPIRWGLVDGAIGVGNATVEDFEDLNLAPGLQVFWESPAGNFGPTSTLPNVFNPNTDDAFGSAFIGGNYDGTRCLLNTRTNKPFNYSDSPSYGDVTFLFSPPVRLAAFSVHQNETDLGLIVNGIDLGKLSSLTGLAPNGAKYGYILVKADGADTISSIKIKNGSVPSGDGFTFDHVAFSVDPAPSLQISGFGPSYWGIDNSSLGVANAVFENFEDATLIPGLSVSWEAPAGNFAPSNTLPHLFNPTSDDAFGTAFIGGVWDGTHCLVSGRGNQSFNYSAGTNWGDIVFHFNPAQQRVGFSVQQMEGPTRIIVNERDIGDFASLSGLSQNSNRQGFFRVKALDGSSISSIRFANTRVGVFGDGIAFDHLTLGGRCLQDLNNDELVDDSDFVIFINEYNILDCADPEIPVGCPADFNADGIVDDADFVIFVVGYNTLLCP